MQGTVLCRRGRNPAEKACRDFSLARSLFSTQRVPAEPLGRRGRHRPAPAPKRHPLPCRYAGQSRSRALRTPTVAAFPSPAGALARRCRSTGAVRGQKLGLPPGSAAWQRGYGHARRGCAQRAGSVPRSACRWVTETGTKTAVQSGLEDGGGGGDGTHTRNPGRAPGRRRSRGGRGGERAAGPAPCRALQGRLLPGSVRFGSVRFPGVLLLRPPWQIALCFSTIGPPELPFKGSGTLPGRGGSSRREFG